MKEIEKTSEDQLLQNIRDARTVELLAPAYIPEKFREVLRGVLRDRREAIEREALEGGISASEIIFQRIEGSFNALSSKQDEEKSKQIGEFAASLLEEWNMK